MLEENHESTCDISSIKRVTRKFLEVSRCGRAKQRQRNVQKSVLHVQSCFFAIVVLSPFSLPSPLKVMLYETIRNDDF